MRFPRASLSELAGMTAEQISKVRIAVAGLGLRWEDVDVDYYLPNMVDGFELSCRAAIEFGRRGGVKKSPAKTAAVRANGKKGGRPKKHVAA